MLFSRLLRLAGWLCLPLFCGVLNARSAPLPPARNAQLLTAEGVVEVSRANSTNWLAGQTNQSLAIGDVVRTGPRSRATLRLSDLTLLRLNELTTIQIRPPREAGQSSLLDVKGGSTYFLGREKPARQEFRTPLTSGAIRGTEFNLSVAEDGRTLVALLEGELSLSNSLGHLDIGPGEQGVVDPGQPPAKTAMLESINIIQWAIYYPGILAPEELGLSSDEQQALGGSLAAYRSGDLLAAAAQYPTNRAESSDAERVYHSALLLPVGQAQRASGVLAEVKEDKESGNSARLASALRELLAVVKNQEPQRPHAPVLASEFMAESYYFQAHSRLAEALDAARRAAEKLPHFGFAWARVAELELSFGHYAKAMSAAERSLENSPRNAEAWAVKGFIFLGRNQTSLAERAFDRAIDLDAALGNAWLGRALCKARKGQETAAREDLHVAAVLEPQRAVLRSYFAKSFSNSGDNPRALRELAIAEKLDPNDPTAWLYSALVEEQQNEVNAAVRDLEKSKELNENRRIFRSKLLLDEDEAVRSANLASIYQDTGIYNWNKNVAMSDWSVQEASRAVNYDYGNFSAHQFLANSYDAFRDPRQINLRYETPWFSELLIAHLLARVGEGNLSEYAAQQQYSRLLEQNHFGLSSDTEYLSHGDWLQRGSQYGTVDNMTYALDAEYHSERGWRPNNDLEQLTLSAKGKAQLTPQDSILVEGTFYNTTFGDVAQYYNQYGTLTNTPAPSRTFRGWERQEPNIFLGYHHEWAPGSHTLFLFGHLDDTLHYADPESTILFTRYSGGTISFVRGDPFSVQYNRELGAYTAELQQIWQTPNQNLVVGGRYQTGDARTMARVDNSNNVPSLVSDQNVRADIDRYNVYAYETVKFFETLELTAGLSYDHLRFPRDIDTPPVTGRETDRDQVSPKAGIIWSPLADTHLRGVFTRSLGGVFYDTSVRLEPTEVAGFNQAFRSVIPESVVGLVPGTRFTTYGVGLDQAFKKSGTYLSIDAEILESRAERTVGTTTNSFFFPIANAPGNTRQRLDFREKSLVASLTQLISDQWSVGALYRVSEAELGGHYIDIPAPASATVNQNESASFQQLTLYGNLYLPCGFFSQAQALWTEQNNHGYTPGLAGADFWQFNLYAGYRFLDRRAELKVGLLNITDRDYRLNPLTLYYDLPRQRTLAVSCKFYF